MTAGERTALIVSCLVSVPYAVVSAAYAHLNGGGMRDFWTALGVLVGLRAVFGLLEFVGGVIAWRLYGRELMVQRFAATLAANRFPAPENPSDDFFNYLAKLDPGPRSRADSRVAAREFMQVFELAENSGILPGMRAHSAAEAAFRRYLKSGAAPVMPHDEDEL